MIERTLALEHSMNFVVVAANAPEICAMAKVKSPIRILEK
jgi:hypothetical protein